MKILVSGAFVLRLALGQMADELLLSSARVIPRRLLDASFAFRDPDLAGALQRMLGSTISASDVK